MKEYIVQLSDKGSVAVDDTILVKGANASAGSRILEGFKPLFSAEAVTRLEEKGYEIVNIKSSGFQRKISLENIVKNISAASKAITSSVAARKILKEILTKFRSEVIKNIPKDTTQEELIKILVEQKILD